MEENMKFWMSVAILRNYLLNVKGIDGLSDWVYAVFREKLTTEWKLYHPVLMYMLKYYNIPVLLLALDTYGLFNATQHAFYQDGKQKWSGRQKRNRGVQ